MQADVIVIGGGATGCGIAWDLSLRGVRVALVEKGGLGAGTSGRYHGLLHSGGCYAVTDPGPAAECAAENLTVRRIAPQAVAPTGGLFVLARDDDPSYVERWLAACGAAGIPTVEITAAAALAREPGLHPGIRRAFTVPDAVCNAFTLCTLLARGAAARGATILTHHDVTDFIHEGQRVVGVRARQPRDAAVTEVRARLTIIAAGPWSAELARGAGPGFAMSLARGSMLAYDGSLVRGVVNRLQPPGDGDILLPRGNVLPGTTVVPTADPNDHAVTPAEVARIQEQISAIIPGVRGRPIKHSWAGVRPLYDGEAIAGQRSDPHLWSRDFVVLDHASTDGVEGLLTIVGGKLTTFRLMAERASDAACRVLGVKAACVTAATPLPALPQ